ncbi:hypothetical protein H0O01_02635 [Candidatus Micrarchaeota archaeon]|nr:hypothetical protein [Candidatus Micrarchaeota archaeon]
MNERHSSSQTPLPPQVRSAQFAERKLQPLSETISGLPAYGNLMGKKFTVECVNKGEGEYCKDVHVWIDEVAPDHKGYLVVAKLQVGQDSIYIHSIDSHVPGLRDFVLSLYFEPPREWKGFDFFSIIMEQVRKIARENGISRIELLPADEGLVRHYKRHGFVEDAKSPAGKMIYRMPEDSATA